MKPSIYAEMCKPSPLSKPPKTDVKMMTLSEVLDMVRGRPRNERRAAIEEWAKSLPELPGGPLAARPDLLKP